MPYGRTKSVPIYVEAIHSGRWGLQRLCKNCGKTKAMSNGDDVLDNWEEIDEEGLQSTLQNLKTKTESSKPKEQKSSTIVISTEKLGTPQQPMKLLQRSAQDSPVVIASRPAAGANNPNLIKSPLDDMAAAFQPVMMVLHKPEDEYQSATYTQPIANQTVKILRRPTQSSEPRNNGMRPKQPIKTLKQREQEYAEARLRILGAAKNPEDDELKAAADDAASPATGTTASSSTPATPTSTTTSTAVALPSFHTHSAASTAMKINSPKTQGGPNIYNNHFQYQQQAQHPQQQQQQQLQLHLTQQQQHQPSLPYQQQGIFHPNQFQQQQPQQQQQHPFYYNQQPQSPAYNNNSNNNNRTFNSMPLLGHGPMGAIGQPAQYQQVPTSPQSVTAQVALQQQIKMQQQYHHKSSQLQQQQQQQQQQHQKQQQQTWSPVVGGSVSSTSVRQQQQQQQPQQPPQSNESILRLPRGPDGSVGFQTRR